TVSLSGIRKSFSWVILMSRRRVDLTGKKFGKLLARRSLTEKHYSGAYLWECLCDCGNIKHVSTTALNSGGVKSCGCIGRGGRLEIGEAAFNNLYAKVQKSARKRGLECTLTETQYRKMISGSCLYCGDPPYQIASCPSWHGDYIYNGLDRVDNHKGYTMSNCVPCCGVCNSMKSDHPQKFYLNKCKQVFKRHGRKLWLSNLFNRCMMPLKSIQRRTPTEDRIIPSQRY
ncbi:hypothetical protein KAR91_78365, partial [Candidatus Pacearchaeota archaeon]|nr:hypothetical protein [Candidatus Pacearchaeota archaeon]